MLRVLVACEESQAVCKAFRALGHEAYSCDLYDQSGGHPEWHITGDCLPYINGNCEFTTTDGLQHKIDGKWDLLIAHPPCTYLSNAGARFLYPNHVLNKERLALGLEAKEFFMKFYNADCDHICIENPTPSTIYQLPPCSQVTGPNEFGVPLTKRTQFWIKGLPTLQPTNIIPKEQCQSTKIAGNWFNKGGKDRQKNRAKTFPQIAEAMAKQWGDYLDKE